MLLWRHIAALRDLSRNNNIIIILSDEGDRVVILGFSHYNNKIMNLLNNKNTYDQISLQIINKNIKDFNNKNKNKRKKKQKLIT